MSTLHARETRLIGRKCMRRLALFQEGNQFGGCPCGRHRVVLPNSLAKTVQVGGNGVTSKLQELDGEPITPGCPTTFQSLNGPCYLRQGWGVARYGTAPPIGLRVIRETGHLCHETPANVWSGAREQILEVGMALFCGNDSRGFGCTGGGARKVPQDLVDPFEILAVKGQCRLGALTFNVCSLGAPDTLPRRWR